MGRPTKAIELHALQGTRAEIQLTGDSCVPAGRPKMHGDLTPAARSVFKRLCKLLQERRALTAGDSELLRLYSIAFDRHRRAMEHVQLEGEITTYISLDKDGVQVPRVKTNLWLKVAQDSERFMHQTLKDLGLTSLNRDKVKPTQKSLLETAADQPGTAAYFLKHGTFNDDGQAGITAPLSGSHSE